MIKFFGINCNRFVAVLDRCFPEGFPDPGTLIRGVPDSEYKMSMTDISYSYSATKLKWLNFKEQCIIMEILKFYK